MHLLVLDGSLLPKFILRNYLLGLSGTVLDILSKKLFAVPPFQILILACLQSLIVSF